jgi:hypothetical protein
MTGASFKRSVKLEIMTTAMVYAISDLRIGFDVALSTDPEPNRATFTITNLSEVTRKALETSATTPSALGAVAVRFSAGYAGLPGLIFAGNVTSVKTTREPTGFITEICAMDGHEEIKKAHFDKSFAAGTPLQKIVAAVAASFGLPFELGFIPANGAIMVGTTYSGSVFHVMNDLCAQLNLKWSIQGGILQVSDKAAPVISAAAQVVILAPDTGLIGSPVVSIDEDPKVGAPIGSIEAVSLLNPLLLPDHPVQILPTNPMTFAGVRLDGTKKIGGYSVKATGTYRIQRARFTGCNLDGDFHSEITCPILGAA